MTCQSKKAKQLQNTYLSSAMIILGQPVSIGIACEPTDVAWDNQAISANQKTNRRYIALLIDFLAMVVLLGAILFVLYYQN
jgi:hypothetical protein